MRIGLVQFALARRPCRETGGSLGHEDDTPEDDARKQAVPGNKLSGKVVEVDAEGNLITDVSAASLDQAPQDASLRIVVDEHETFGVYPSDHSQPSMTLVAIAEPDNPLKIVLVDDSASAMLGVQVGAAVELSW